MLKHQTITNGKYTTPSAKWLKGIAPKMQYMRKEEKTNLNTREIND
jgi:hypothetical protein